MELSGAVAVVTGATEGIGRAIAFQLGSAGAKLAICARTEPNVRATVQALRDARIDAVGMACDVSDPAGAMLSGPPPQNTTRAAGARKQCRNRRFKSRCALVARGLGCDEWPSLSALLLMARAFVQACPGRAGTIVNKASLAGRHRFEGAPPLRSKMRCSLLEALMLRGSKHNIRVVAVCPGSVATPFMDKQSRERPNRDRVLAAADVAHVVVSSLTLSDRAMVSELDIRPTNP